MKIKHSKRAQKLIDNCKLDLEWYDLADLVAHNGEDCEVLAEKCFKFAIKYQYVLTLYKLKYNYDILYFHVFDENSLVNLIRKFIKNNE